MTSTLYLASRSPRRSALLTALGYRCCLCPADIDETPLPGEAPKAFAQRMAIAKAQAAVVAGVVLAADTDVSIDGEILGKPADEAHALSMLMRLSGRGHEVHSAVAVRLGDRLETVQTVTEVVFGQISEADARTYWRSGEPADKAGAYAIQGGAARWVREIHGSYTGVVGLPLYEAEQLLHRFGVSPGVGLEH